jgi:hypothetical protein
MGGGDGLLDSRNRAYYVFVNDTGRLIGIREDYADPSTGQLPHFNSGPAGSVQYPSNDLNNHSYWLP